MNPFETALELFGDNGEHWTQGSAVAAGPDGELQFCSGGALHYVCTPRRDIVKTWTNGTAVAYGFVGDVGPEYEIAMNILQQHVNRAETLAGVSSIVHWNDSPSRVYEDIRLTFKHCAADYEEFELLRAVMGGPA